MAGRMALEALSSAGVGRSLRDAREERGLGLREVTQATRIASRYLEALEDDAPLDAFPAPVYARFFLREYAQFLDLDETGLIEAFVARHGSDDEVPIEEAPLLDVRPPSRWPARLAVAASSAILLTLAIVAFRSNGPGLPLLPMRGSPGLLAAAGVSPVPDVAGSQRAANQRGTIHGPATRGSARSVNAVLDVRERCWIQAVADGRTVLQETVAAGRSVTLHAQSTLSLELGYAKGVDLTVNGQTVRTAGTVMRLAFALRQGRVVTV